MTAVEQEGAAVLRVCQVCGEHRPEEAIVTTTFYTTADGTGPSTIEVTHCFNRTVCHGGARAIAARLAGGDQFVRKRGAPPTDKRPA